MQEIFTALTAMRRCFDSGATRTYAFRVKQLELLKASVLKHEKAISAALYADLKKSPEEAYAAETGLVLAEINQALKSLRSWMRPERIPTNMMNLPSGSTVYHDPLGVVLIIAPWNYPLQLLLVPLTGAIAGGNCTVLKPSELARATAAVIDTIISEVFSPEYIWVVQGDGAEIVPALMRSFRFDHVFYTGSTAVGREVYRMAAEQLVPVTLELGGKSPAIVEKDADLAVAARRIALGKFLNAGQTCVAPDYVLVHRDVKEGFIAQLKQTIARFYSADPGKSNDFGKIINAKRFDVIVQYLNQGKVVYGGQHSRECLFIAPTILEDVPLDAPVMTEEIFGPVLPVYPFGTRQEALQVVQRNPDPLAFYLFTQNRVAEEEWITALPFGGGCVNNTAWQVANPNLPFGGVGTSGIGAYHGKYSFDTFTRRKPVMRTPVWFDPAVKYPPFGGKLKLLRWLIR